MLLHGVKLLVYKLMSATVSEQSPLPDAHLENVRADADINANEVKFAL